MRLKIALPLIGVLGLMGELYGPVIRDLAEVWETDANYSHGFLIPVVALYLVWLEKDAFPRLTVAPALSGTILIAASLFLLLVGESLETVVAGTGGLFVKGISFPLLLSGLVLLLLGRSYLGILWPALAYLLFMVPLPGGVFKLLTLPMQDYTTRVATSALQLFGVSAFRDGNIIVLPSSTLGVVEACSGIRSLLTLLALACAIVVVFLPRRHGLTRWLLVISAVPIAILTNAFRVTVTGLMAHFCGIDAALGPFHDLAGLGAFLCALALLVVEVFLVGRLSDDFVQEACL